MSNRVCVIEQLLERPFLRRTKEEQLKIIHSGRQCPELPNLLELSKRKDNNFHRRFHIKTYNSVEWLTGSEKFNRLFCWPCLLFTTEFNVWSRNGYKSLKNLHMSMNSHEKTTNHILCVLRLKTFLSTLEESQSDSQLCASTEQHNGMVRKNRDILKRFIDTVCFLAVHELPICRLSESGEPVNNGLYLGAINLLSKYDVSLSSHLEPTYTFNESLDSIQDDLILSTCEVLQDRIKQEISNAVYITLMLDEISEVMNTPQLATSLRYVDSESGELNDRFISSTCSDRSANCVFEHVQNVVTVYGLSNKIMSLTFDGAVVMPGQINELISKIQEHYPTAVFIHCFNHELNFILSQSASFFKECRTFFQNLSGLESFFQKSSKRIHALTEYTTKEMPLQLPTRWNFTSHIVKTIKDHFVVFVGFFQTLLDQSANWDNETVIASQGFLNFLTSQETSFLLTTFNEIFCFTNDLSSVLTSKNLDITCCCQKVQETVNNLQNLRNKCDPFWSETEEYIEGSEETNPRKFEAEDPGVFRPSLHNEIIDTVIKQISERFGSLNCLRFVSLLDPQYYCKYSLEFPTSLYSALFEFYNNQFDIVRLRNELTVLYSHQDFSGQYPSQLIKSLKRRQLITTLPEIYKLALLIVTIPTFSVDQPFSSLTRIKSYLQLRQSNSTLSALDFLSIEKNLLCKLKYSPTFYDDVIVKFAREKRRIDFTYK